MQFRKKTYELDATPIRSCDRGMNVNTALTVQRQHKVNKELQLMA